MAEGTQVLSLPKTSPEATAGNGNAIGLTCRAASFSI